VHSTFDLDKKRHSAYEVVSLIAFEGSTLTLMGLVNYDAKLDQIRMTDVSGIVAGGLKECKEILKTKIIHQKVTGWIIGTLTAVCALVCGVMLYTKYTENRVNRLVRAQHEAEV